jgi:expansin (peptidoglycan-binding protein)
MSTHSWWKQARRLLTATPLLWFIACSSDGVTGGPPGGAGSSGSGTGTSGAPAHAGAAGSSISNGGAPFANAGASGSGIVSGAGAGGLSGAAGGSLSGAGAGGSVAGAGAPAGGATDPCATVKCGTGQTCSNGTCKCTTGTLCTDACYDTQSDQNHCGDCSTKCAADGACVSGKCVNPMCNPDTQQRNGHVTTYNLATSLVACHYPTDTLPQYYGAMNQYDWNNSGVCGACVEITNGGKKLVVQITDECPDVEPNKMWCFQGSHHIDLNPAAYGALGANNNPAVSWKYVPCTSTGNIKFNFDKACQQYYLAVTPMNVKNVVAKMEVMTKDGYVALTHTDYNTYELKTGNGTGAMTFRLTDIYNHVITDTVTMAAGQVVQGAKQFAACP